LSEPVEASTRINRVGLWSGLGVAIFVLFLSTVTEPPEGLTPAGMRLIAVTLLMSIWWITEAIPLGATGLVPIALFPLLDVVSVKQLAPGYANPVVLLLLGGFLLATAVEKSRVHTRLALHTLLLVGTSPRRLVLGFGIATGALSMWIANTSATLIMMPVAMALVDRALQRSSGDEARRFGAAVMLVCAYGASIGGMGTPVGTPPNLLAIGAMRVAFPEQEPLTFVTWCIAALPVVVLLIPILWLMLTRVYPKVPASLDLGEDTLVRQELASLGPWRPSEVRALGVFAVTALLWVTRPDTALSADFKVPGWASLLGLKGTDDSMVAMLAAVVAFALPDGDGRGERLLPWRAAAKAPWGLVLLFGGGVALSEAFEATGLSGWLGAKLSVLASSPALFMAVAAIAATFVTEIMSNTALATILMPILASAAKAAQLDPRMLLVPTALACSCAFMMPAATGPNAIVFGTGRMRIGDMVKAGFTLNMVSWLVIVLVALITYG
jgi:sodium-dependent dicarboxylate transporter 2/3/5